MYDTQKAIGLIKQIFLEKLCGALHLKRVTAPLFVDPATGLNDDLNGVERPVTFDVPALRVQTPQVVHSPGQVEAHGSGISTISTWATASVTDMNAIRRDEELDNLHSIYVDQWDWEKVITREDAEPWTICKQTVQDIVDAICGTLDELKWQFPALERLRAVPGGRPLSPRRSWRTSYPDADAEGAGERFCQGAHGTVFIMGIGGALKSGKPHDGRAPDYDDWTLNGDLLFWNEPLGCALELSSMGIRVDAGRAGPPADAWRAATTGAALPFHKMLLDGRAAPDHRRRHRPEPPVHAAAGQSPRWRGAGVAVGR